MSEPWLGGREYRTRNPATLKLRRARKGILNNEVRERPCIVVRQFLRLKVGNLNENEGSPIFKSAAYYFQFRYFLILIFIPSNNITLNIFFCINYMDYFQTRCNEVINWCLVGLNNSKSASPIAKMPT